MSTNKTTNLGLHSWVREDPFKMDEFNENFGKIDEAVGKKAEADTLSALQTELSAAQTSLALKAEIVTGTYQGDGKESRTFDLGFKPKAVLVVCQMGATGAIGGGISMYGGLALPNYSLQANGVAALTITDTGFKVAKYSSGTSNADTNNSLYRYFYIAFK